MSWPVFDPKEWVGSIKRSPIDLTVGAVLGLALTWIAHHIGVPTLDALSAPLTGLGYAIIFFVASFLFLGLIGLFRFAFPLEAKRSKMIFGPRSNDSGVRLPYDIDARSALLYAANGTWIPRPDDTGLDGAEVDRIQKALDLFYELASSGSLHVWVEKTVLGRQNQ